MFTNRFIAIQKRLLLNKAYITVLLIMILIPLLYNLLPAKAQSSNINIAILSYDENTAAIHFIDRLNETTSVFTFYSVSNENQLHHDVQRGDAECGFIIPENFFSTFVNETAYRNPIIQYVSPASTMIETTSEIVYSKMMEIFSADILCSILDMSEKSDAIHEYMNNLMTSDEVFSVIDYSTNTEQKSDDFQLITLPLQSIIYVLLILSSLLGLLMYLRDHDRKIYIALTKQEHFSLKVASILCSILPATIIGIISLTFNKEVLLHSIMNTISFSTIVFIITILLSFIIKKSTQLNRVLPLIVFISMLIAFIQNYETII